MLEVLFWILLGVFIGWNITQPAYAKRIQDAVVNWFKNFRRK